MSKYDKEFLKKNLYSGVISDVLDGMGYRNQMIGNKIFPLKDDTVISGPAFTSIASARWWTSWARMRSTSW